MMGWGHGHGIIMDQHYRVVKTVEPGSYQASSDMHEFKLLPDGRTALMTQYLRRAYDLCEYGICNGLGYIHEGAFQEIEVDTGKVLYEWRSLDHVDPSESYVLPDTTEVSGDGRTAETPWDYFHLNSVDKNADGDYLISARHVSCVYKISGKDGRVLWRLNGVQSNFTLVDFDFSFQHDARFVSEDEDETVISLFDNGSDGYNDTQEYSAALVIKIDHIDHTVIPLKEYKAPQDISGLPPISRSQGNMQLLPNGNVLIGWGNVALWSEHLDNGTCVWYGSIGSETVMNYRTHKFDWIGVPLTKPALWAYSKTGAN